MQPSFRDKDKWSAHAPSYPKSSSNQLINTPAEILLSQMDRVYHFSTSSAILDVGCGPGSTIGRLIESYGSQIPQNSRLIASDFSAGMIERVQEQQKKAQEEGGNIPWSRVEPKVLDTQVLEGIEDGSISHITGTHVYMLLENGHQALEAAYRVLQPGGILGMTNVATAELMDLLGEAATKIRGETAPRFQFPKGFSTLDGIQGELEAVGFKLEYANELVSYMDVSDPKFLLGFVRGNNPGVKFFVENYSDVEMDMFVEELLKLVNDKHPEVPRKLKGVNTIVVGKKV
jgi:ubiquinone/menaquinone biosynthesis C-methylase UbiE